MMGMKADDAVVEELQGKLSTILDVYEARLSKSKYLAGLPTQKSPPPPHLLRITAQLSNRLRFFPVSLKAHLPAPKNQRVHGGKSSRSPGNVPQQSPSSEWDNIITFLDLLMIRLRGNYVPSFFIRKLTTQVFSFINIQLFNSLLLRRECCTFSNGEYVKSGLAELDKWIVNAAEEFAGTSWHELNCIRQAVGFLVALLSSLCVLHPSMGSVLRILTYATV